MDIMHVSYRRQSSNSTVQIINQHSSMPLTPVTLVTQKIQQTQQTQQIQPRPGQRQAMAS
jgi:hypothetical protein